MTEMSKENLARVGRACIGAVAGVSVWLLTEVLPETVESERLLLWLGSAVLGFFTLLLGLLGPLKSREAAGVAAVLGLTAAALFYWSSLRFVEVDDVFEMGFNPAAFAILVFIGAPFGAAVVKGRVFDYAYLFDTAWGLVVRYLAAWIFVGLFWAALFLSNALLEIVGITAIKDVVDIEVMPHFLTGLVLGLALAVANELRAYVSPYLLLRLLRLLIPPLVLVVGVFIMALPFRGLSGLFGDFSAAGTLMAVAIAGASLIAAALDSSDDEAVGSAIMRLATRAFAAMLPILGVLAVWAIVIRVMDYGWTPERLAAFVAALFVLAYGVLYGAALIRSDWMARIRRANVYHAMAVLVVAALWLTPILDASRISANTQVARFLQGKSELANLPAWEMAHEWGKAGQRALARLQTLEEEAHPGLQILLSRAETDSRWEFNRDAQSGVDRRELAAQVMKHTKVFPEASDVPAAALVRLDTYLLESLAQNCPRSTCVFIRGQIGASSEAKIVAFVPKETGGADVSLFEHRGGALYLLRRLQDVDQDTFETVAAGQFEIAPSSLKSIWVGDTEIAAGRLGRQFNVVPLE